jgi:hypothetical protein
MSGTVNPRHRLGDEDHVLSVTDCFNRRRRVVVDAGAVVVARQVGRDHVVTPLPQQGRNEVPVPVVRPGAVQQHIGGHHHSDARALWNSSRPQNASDLDRESGLRRSCGCHFEDRRQISI